MCVMHVCIILDVCVYIYIYILIYIVLYVMSARLHSTVWFFLDSLSPRTILHYVYIHVYIYIYIHTCIIFICKKICNRLYWIILYVIIYGIFWSGLLASWSSPSPLSPGHRALSSAFAASVWWPSISALQHGWSRDPRDWTKDMAIYGE